MNLLEMQGELPRPGREILPAPDHNIGAFPALFMKQGEAARYRKTSQPPNRPGARGSGRRSGSCLTGVALYRW